VKYTKQVSVGGDWVKKGDLKSGMKAVIVSETLPVPSQWEDKKGNLKNQDVCKVKFDGFETAYNVALNRATINGLVDAHGEDSKDWMNKPLSVEVEKQRVSGRAVIALYLIPQGFHREDDQDGYAIIVRDEDHRPQSRSEDEDSGHVDDVNGQLMAVREKKSDLPF